jgi:predicted RNase H-like HicB family nuclease
MLPNAAQLWVAMADAYELEFLPKTTARGTLGPMSDTLHLTIVYEQDPDSDWIVASIPEVPGVHSQGHTREEAREMVLDALGGMLELRAAAHEPIGKTMTSESLVIVAA